MRKLWLGISFIFVIGILAGCISIPVGDDIMKISSDGIDFEPKDGEEKAEDEEKKAEKEEVEEDETEVEAAEEEDETDGMAEGSINQEEEEELDGGQDPLAVGQEMDDEEVDEEQSDEDQADQACEEEDHSEVLDLMDGDFHIPDCATLAKIDKQENNMQVRFIVEDGDWEEVVADYQEFFEDSIFKDNKNVSIQRADIGGYLNDGEKNKTDISVRQEGENIRIDVKYEY